MSNALIGGGVGVRVTIDDRSIDVEVGTTVAAALVMAGKSGTRTSVGGEPRAALCGMGVCQECRVTIDGRQYALACQTLCRDGQTICTGTTGMRGAVSMTGIADNTGIANTTDTTDTTVTR